MATQPVEDIDAVLGRFQAWTGAREATGMKAGVRELSDEEALASGRYRWKPERVGTAKNAAAAAQPRTTTVGPQVPAREREKTAAAKTPQPKSRVARQKNHAPSRAQSPKPSPRKEEKARPAFREVLAEAVKPAEVLVKAQPVELSRQLAISIRLAPSERALIKTRAAEAGITASAYIRQCALEVEQLREQVRQAVAAMDRGGPASPVATSAPPRGFLGWMARKFLPRRSPALALRA